MLRRLIAGQVVPWRRFWASSTTRLSAGHDGRGFLHDPEDELGRALNPQVHHLGELLNRPCLVLSGQPGIGKTTEVEELAASTDWLQPTERLIKLSGRLLHSPEELRWRTVESADWKSAISNGGSVRLLLDGVDEELRRLSVLVLDLVDSLKEQPLDRIKVILVCRAAEWHHADGQALASLWREDASSTLFELCPLRWKDVALAARMSNVDPDSFWREITRHRVQGLAARPITLRLLWRKCAQVASCRATIMSVLASDSTTVRGSRRRTCTPSASATVEHGADRPCWRADSCSDPARRTRHNRTVRRRYRIRFGTR